MSIASVNLVIIVRIAFAYDSAFPWIRGGIERRRHLVMQKFVNEGHEVHLFTMLREGMKSTEFTYEGVRFHCVGDATETSKMYKKDGVGRRNIRWPLKYAILLMFKIWLYRFDILDADSFPFLHILPLSIYAKLTGTTFVVTWHEVWDLKYWNHYLGALGFFGYLAEKIAAIASKKKIANSSLTREALMRVLNVKKDEIVLFPAAVSGDEVRSFLRKHKVKKENVFVSINRLVPQKRVDIAIRAMTKVPNAKYNVIGMGPDEKKLKELAAKLGVGKRVSIFDINNREKLFTEICRSKALLMMSEREGLSLVSLEAMALGTEVVTIKSTMLPREVKRFTLEASEGELGSFLKKLLEKEKSRDEKLSENVLKEFSADRAVELYKSLT